MPTEIPVLDLNSPTDRARLADRVSDVGFGVRELLSLLEETVGGNRAIDAELDEAVDQADALRGSLERLVTALRAGSE